MSKLKTENVTDHEQVENPAKLSPNTKSTITKLGILSNMVFHPLEK